VGTSGCDETIIAPLTHRGASQRGGEGRNRVEAPAVLSSPKPEIRSRVKAGSFFNERYFLSF